MPSGTCPLTGKRKRITCVVSEHLSFGKCFSSFIHFYLPIAWEIKISYCKIMWEIVKSWMGGAENDRRKPSTPGRTFLTHVQVSREAWAPHILQPPTCLSGFGQPPCPVDCTSWPCLPSVHFLSSLWLCPNLGQCQLSPRLLLPFFNRISTLKSAWFFKNANLIILLCCSKFFGGFPLCWG